MVTETKGASRRKNTDRFGAVSLDDPALYIDRELSWIRFNGRVFEEARDPWHPVLERVKFLAICGSNLDEFFMTRVSRIQKRIRKGSKKRSVQGLTSFQQISTIRKLLLPLVEGYGDYWRMSMIPHLAKNGIMVQRMCDLRSKDRKKLRKIFEEEILPTMEYPIADFTRAFVHNLRVNLLVVASGEGGGERPFIVEMPTGQFSRLIEIPGRGKRKKKKGASQTRFVFIEDLVASNLDLLFPDTEVSASYVFRLTRNAEIDIMMDESADFLDVVDRSIRTRESGFPTRLQFERRMPKKYREMLANLFGLPSFLVFEWNGPLGLVDLWQIHKLERPELKDKAFLPYLPPLLKRGKKGKRPGILMAIAESDMVLYHPYDGFEVIIELLEEAAEDPDVSSIAITVYRIDSGSPIIRALKFAAEMGKKVTAFIELKAKFDEKHNIDLAWELRKAGVQTVYRFPDIKLHAKLCLIERVEGGELVRYSHIGSGNYHAITTKIYGDTGYLTARPEIGEELAKLFGVLRGDSLDERDFSYLLVAPKTLKSEILRRISREVRVHRKTGDGYLAFKLNGLEDKDIIKALYFASGAGVTIDLNVRGLCCLRPGLEGVSDNISVISIVGRFLEHARVYYFRNGGDDEILLGSSDMMFRNLNKRIEVLFSVPDNGIKQQIFDSILQVHLNDNVKARRLLPDGNYEKVVPADGSGKLNSQEWLIENRGIWHGSRT